MKLMMIVLAAGGFFLHLIQQSKRPAGYVGKLMMSVWNKAYFPMIKWALSNIEKVPSLEILDVGIGNGLSSEYLCQQFPNAQLYGIDLSSEAIKQTKRRFPHETANFQVQTIEKTTFANQQFDLICAFQTHFHWSNLEAAFEEISRILKPEGLFLIACELNKINIYLPDWTEEGQLQLFLAKHGFVLAQTSITKSFVKYEIRKLPE